MSPGAKIWINQLNVCLLLCSPDIVPARLYIHMHSDTNAGFNTFTL